MYHDITYLGTSVMEERKLMRHGRGRRVKQDLLCDKMPYLPSYAPRDGLGDKKRWNSKNIL